MNNTDRQQPARLTYTLAQAAEHLGGITVQTLKAWSDRHGLRITRIAGKPMVLHEDLMAFIHRDEAA